MNFILTLLATLLVLVLGAAAIGPSLIDWSVYRATIEENAARLLGTEVAIHGEAELRLLPSPRIRATDVRLGPADAPIVEAGAVELDVALTPLLSRELQVRDLRLAAPVATVRIEEDGTVRAPALALDTTLTSLFDVTSAAVDNVAVTDGTLVLLDRRDGSRTLVDNVAFTGSARTLRGPFSLTGAAVLDGVEHRIRLGGGASVSTGAIPLTARVEPLGRDLALSVDGTLDPATLAFAGRLEASGTAGPQPFAVRGEVRASTAALTLDRAVLTFGPEAAGIDLALRAGVPLVGLDPATVALEARQIDLDRLARALAPAPPADAADAPPAPIPPEASALPLLAHLAPLLAAGAGLDEVALSVDVGTLVWGSSLVRDVSAAAHATPDALRLDRAEALLPGDTALTVTGRLRDGFSGRLEAESAQPGLLARWWTGGAALARPVPPVVVAADVTARGDAVELTRLDLRAGESTLRGSARWQRGPDRPSFDAALDAPRLALEDALALAPLWDGTATPDVTVQLAADTVTAAGLEARGLSVDAGTRRGALEIADISVDDFAGGRLHLSGTITDIAAAPAGRIAGEAEVTDGAAIAAALRRLFPGDPTAERIATAVPTLVPATLAVDLTGAEAGSALALALDGTFAGTRLALSASGTPLGADWTAHPTTVRLQAEGADPAILLAQLGIPATAAEGAARIDVDLSGTPREAWTGTAALDLLGAEARWSGTLQVADIVTVDGDAALRTDDPAPLATALSRPLPDLGPVDLRARLTGRADDLALAALTGTVGGVTVAGDLALRPAALTGTLAVSDARLDAIAALLLGADAVRPTPDSLWPAQAFAVPLAFAPAVDVALTTPRLAAGPATLRDASLRLRLEGGRIALDELAATAAGGQITGALALSRDGPRATLSGTLALAEAEVARVLSSPDTLLDGRLDLDLTLSAGGTTLSGLVANLSGSGVLRAEAARIPGLAPIPAEAIEPLVAAGVPPLEDAVRTLVSDHLRTAALDLLAVEAPVQIAAGTARIADVALGALDTPVRVDAALDLAAGAVRLSATLPVVAGEGEPAPAVTLMAAGPLAAPKRTLDVTPLTAWISLRALERQVQEVERQNRELSGEAPLTAPIDGAAPPPADPIADLLRSSVDQVDGARTPFDQRQRERQPLDDELVRRLGLTPQPFRVTPDDAAPPPR